MREIAGSWIVQIRPWWRAASLMVFADTLHVRITELLDGLWTAQSGDGGACPGSSGVVRVAVSPPHQRLQQQASDAARGAGDGIRTCRPWLTTRRACCLDRLMMFASLEQGNLAGRFDMVYDSDHGVAVTQLSRLVDEGLSAQ